MRRLRNTDIRLPDEVTAWLGRVENDPAVERAVLFGSRTTGYARPESDWDVAVVVRPGSEPDEATKHPGFMSSQVHGPVVIESDVFLRDCEEFHTLACEAAEFGVLLCGDESTTMPKEVRTNPVAESRRWIAMTQTMWKNVFDELRNIAGYYPGGALDYTTGQDSANAVELAVKAHCVAAGIPFARSHDMKELATGMPAEWRSAVFGHERRSKEGLSRAVRRFCSKSKSKAGRHLSALFAFLALESVSESGRPDLIDDDWSKMHEWFAKQSETIDTLLSNAPAELDSLFADFRKALAAQKDEIERHTGRADSRSS